MIQVRLENRRSVSAVFLRAVLRSVNRRLDTLMAWHHCLLTPSDLPKEIRHILIICKGNICRSPLAEAYLRSLFQLRESSVTVKSAGLETSLGKPAHPLAKDVGRQVGLFLDTHVTQPLCKEHLEAADLILVMERAHHSHLMRLYPEIRKKLFVLGRFNRNTTGLEIADPYGGTPEDFQRCFQAVRESCDRLIDKLSAQDEEKHT